MIVTKNWESIRYSFRDILFQLKKVSSIQDDQNFHREKPRNISVKDLFDLYYISLPIGSQPN